MNMKYEKFLESFCDDYVDNKGADDIIRIGLPLRVRFKKWRLERQGYFVRVVLEYHHCRVNPAKCGTSARGYGFARIYKYKLPSIKKGV